MRPLPELSQPAPVRLEVVQPQLLEVFEREPALAPILRMRQEAARRQPSPNTDLFFSTMSSHVSLRPIRFKFLFKSRDCAANPKV